MTLQRRKTSYAYASRTVVPKDLRPLVQRREIVRSLETCDLRDARLRAAEYEGRVATLFRRLREGSHLMDRSHLDALVAHYLDSALDEVEVHLATSLPAADELGRDVWRDGVIEQIEQAEEALACGDYHTMVEVARGMLPGASSDTAVAVLSRRLLEARHDALMAELQALNGKPLPRRVTVPVATIEPPQPPSPLLSTVVSDYVSFKKAGGKWTPKTAMQLVTLFRVMVEMVGDKPVRDVTKDDMRGLYRLLPQLPTHSTKRYPKMTAVEAIAAADADGNDERLSPKSQNDYFTHIKSLFKWAVENDYVEKSAAVVLKDVDESAAWDQRPAFTDEQLTAYFGALKGEPEAAALWVPRLMLFAGLRTEEAAKLVPEDIREEQGVWVFDINRRHGRLKTKNADRLVPIHSAILNALLKYADGRPKGVNLWGLRINAQGTFSAALSKRLNDVLDRMCPEDDRLVCYSLRHTFATRLKHADVQDSLLDELLGHKVERLSVGRYGKRYPAEKLREAVERLKVPV
jgi:integrase